MESSLIPQEGGSFDQMKTLNPFAFPVGIPNSHLKSVFDTVVEHLTSYRRGTRDLKKLPGNMLKLEHETKL